LIKFIFCPQPITLKPNLNEKTISTNTYVVMLLFSKKQNNNKNKGSMNRE